MLLAGAALVAAPPAVQAGPVAVVAVAEPGSAPDSLAAPAPDLAPAPAEVLRVGTVSVAGNQAIESGRILRSFEVPSGMRYSPDAIKRGVTKLFALGLFDDIRVDRIPRGAEIDLVIHVVERPRIRTIQFTGHHHKDTEELEGRLIVRAGEPYSPVAVQAQIDSLLKFYREDGYSQAAVEAVTDTVADGLVLRFAVREGEKVKITRIVFAGATAFPEKALRKAIKTKKKRFIGGGGVDEDKLREDHGRLEAYYRDRGYRDARVLGHELQPGATPKQLILVMTVEEGPRYRMGRVSWNGNTQLGTTTLEKYWQPKPDELYNHSQIEKSQQLAYADYMEEGFLYVGIEATETVRDSVVDVAFEVSEGQPSRVRMVHITGNRATREKVIRREIDVREGDRFKRSLLVRSREELMRLGFFEDVQPDFAAADSSDVDIIFRVKEKTVGTASAGAGYTGQGGLTGFVEIGHSNVLGNGQSLNLHLERGAKRSDYSLSFTEPWFRDTPTLLGFSMFTYDRELDLYREARRGGSVRVGRPLRWPDFSRGSLSYSLEDVTIEQLADTLTATDSLTLAGIPLGRGVRTSSVTLSFLRNSADHPLYPTKGTRLSLTSEFAGGAFGGGINFHKHRLEQRVYFKSLIPNFTSMVRARIGAIGTYTGQTTPVPPYERFRLGGGTTPDPLRGYDDYTVVPEKFIQDVPVDSTRTVRVRYPGGRFMLLYSVEQQFPIVHPLHGVLFFDAGNAWDLPRDIRPFDLKLGAGIGFRMEIPLLGVIGFDYGYGFNRDDRPKAVGHFIIGQTSF